eukprot:669535-Pyramimonas_sp.AAC.1
MRRRHQNLILFKEIVMSPVMSPHAMPAMPACFRIAVTCKTCGDLLFLGTSPIMWHGPTQNFVDALDVLSALDVDFFIPGHGPVTDIKAVQ